MKMGENAFFERSLENLRLCEVSTTVIIRMLCKIQIKVVLKMILHFQVHFEPSDLLVVGNRKEVKKDTIPSRFCHCPSVLQDSSSNYDLYIEHSCTKSHFRKRKKEETHVRNVKAKVDTSENSNQHIEHSCSKQKC